MGGEEEEGETRTKGRRVGGGDFGLHILDPHPIAAVIFDHRLQIVRDVRCLMDPLPARGQRKAAAA